MYSWAAWSTSSSEKPTLTGSPQHDRLALDYWQALRPRLSRGAMAVVVRSLDPRSYDEATRLPGSRQIAPGVVSLRGSDGVTGAGAASLDGRDPSRPGPGHISPWLPVAAAPALLILLLLIGLPLTRWLFPDGPSSAQVALAPSLSLAAVSLDALIVDAAGLRLISPVGVAAVQVLAGAEVAAALVIRHQQDIRRLRVRPGALRGQRWTKTTPSSS